MKVYATNHEISATVCRAFAKGFGCAVLPPFAEDVQDDAAFYGLLRGTGDIVKRRWACNQKFTYIDLGYINPGHYAGYYRVCDSDLHVSLARDPDHRRLLNLQWRPIARGRGLEWSPVLLARPSETIGKFFGFDPDEWVKDTVKRIREFTNRPVSVSRKEDKSGTELLKGAWCVMALQSNLTVEAVRQGVPVVNPPEMARVTHPSRAMGCELKSIETPWYPTVEERTQWAAILAGQQWRLDEIARGECRWPTS